MPDTIEVAVPDLGVVEFPSDTPHDEISAAIEGHRQAKPGLKLSPYEEAYQKYGIKGSPEPSMFVPGSVTAEDLGPVGTLGKAAIGAVQDIQQYGLRPLIDLPASVRRVSAPAMDAIGESVSDVLKESKFASGGVLLGPGGMFGDLPLAAPEEKGIIPSLSRGLEGLIAPANLPFFIAPQSKLVQGMFGTEAAAQIPESIEAMRQAESPAERRGAATDLLLNAAIAGGLGKSLLTRKGIPNARSIETPATGIPGGIGGRGGQSVRLVQTARQLSSALREGSIDDLQHILASTPLDEEEMGRINSQLSPTEQSTLETIRSASLRGRSISEAAQEAIALFNRQKEASTTSGQIPINETERTERSQERSVGTGAPLPIKASETTPTTQQKRTKYAGEKREAKTFYESLSAQPITGLREVPPEISSPGIQPQAPRESQTGAPARVAEEASLPVEEQVERYKQITEQLRTAPLEEHPKLLKESQALLGAIKASTIKRRIKEGIEPEHVQITVNNQPEVPEAGYVQVDEIHPDKGNTFSSNPEKLSELGLDVPASKELLTLPNGRYTLPEAERLLAEKKEPVLANTPTADVLEQRSGTGLPPGVPDRGEQFPSELMEASRQLGTAIRSRATLRPGVMGQYVRGLAGIRRQDKIEVGNISDQNTVAHEMGHKIDGLIFPQQNFGTSQISLAQRVGTGTPKELHSELVQVSELIRGPIQGSTGHQRYRKSATELIADFFALYAHDPERARTLAPKFSEGFETKLAQHPVAYGVVHQLVEGSVEPLPPTRPALPATSPAEMPGKAGIKTSVEPPTREAAAAKAAETAVKDATRLRKAQEQRTRIVADQWRKQVPIAAERNDVGAFAEGIGNIAIPGDTINAVRSRMTPEMKSLAKTYRFAQEKNREEINRFLKDSEQGEYLAFLVDYLPHYYADAPKKIAGLIGKWVKESPHAKQRKLPTLQEARDLGLTPLTQDVATLHELSSNINWRVATNRKFVSELDSIHTVNGSPIIMPAGKAPDGWVRTDNPLVQRIYARKTPGGTMLWRGGAAIHPDAWHAVRQMLERPVSGDFWKAYDTINALSRAGVFALSGFHDIALRAAALGTMARWYNPARGLVRIGEVNPLTGQRELVRSTRSLGKEMMTVAPVVEAAAKDGLQFAHTQSESYQKQAVNSLERWSARFRDTPLAGTALKGLSDLHQWRQTGLWRNTHDAYKTVAHFEATARALENAPPGADVSKIREQVASLMNDAYGGQEWETKFWLSPEMRMWMGRLWLAPDWTLSTLRSVPGISDIASTVREQAPRIVRREAFPTSKEGTAGNLLRGKFWGAEMAAIGAATVGAQYAIYQAFGDPNKGDKPWVWHNEYGNRRRVDITPLMRRLPWRDANDPTRFYANLGKRPEEILRWSTSLDQQIMAKASRPAAEIVKQLTGTEGDFKADWKRDHEAFLEQLASRLKSASAEFLPFSFRGNQFALSAPYRKGMTKFKAQQAYESVYELAADPGRTTKLKAFMRGVPSPNADDMLPDMVTQISDAAERNGVAAEKVRQHALSIVRGHHYDLFFKAFQAGKFKDMDNEAEILLRLGATSKGMSESIKRKMELMPK